MRNQRGFVALLVTLLIWGTTFIATKVVLRDVGPLLLTALRFIIAFAALVPFAVRQGFKLKDVFRPTFMLFGLTGTTLYYALQNVGMNLTSITSTSLILSIGPVLTAVLAVIFLKESMTRWRALGIGLVTVGMVLVALSSTSDTAGSNPVLGDILIFCAGLSWAAYTIQGRKLVGDYSALVMTTASTGAGLLFLLPFAGWELASGVVPHFTVTSVVGILYLGLAASALTMFLWNVALHCLPASVAATYLNLVPVIGVVSGFIMGERPPALQIVGGALAILGVWLSSRTSASATANT